MWDAQLENLAFGQTTPKLSSCVGLFISPDAMFLSEAQMKSGKPVITQLLRVAVPQDAAKDPRTTAALNTEVLANPAKLAETLAPILSQSRWKSRHLVVSLSHSFGLLRYFTMPVIDRRYWATAIPAEAKKHVPLSFTDLVHDFEVVPLAGKGDRRATRLGVLFMTAPKKNIEGIKVLADKVGFNLLGVEMSPCSVERLWDCLEGRAQPESYAHVHFEGGNAQVLVSHHGWPILFREVHLGAEPKIADSRRVDLSGSIEFSKKQLGLESINDARLTGSVPEIESWRDVFSQETGIKVRITQESLNSLGFKTAEWGGYASVGCALQHMAPTPLRLDLTLSRKISLADMRAVKTLFTTAALIAGWFLILAIGRYTKVMLKQNDLRAFHRKDQGIDAFTNRSPTEIQKIVEAMEDKAKALSVISRPSVRATYVLEDVANTIPEGVWLSQISYSNSVDGKARHLNLSGYATEANQMEGNDLAIAFQTKLQNSPHLGRTFVCPAPSLQNAAFKESGAGVSATSERRTSFVLDCPPKRT